MYNKDVRILLIFAIVSWVVLSGVASAADDITPPLISITCPSSSPTYNTPTVTVVGTASDTESGINRVEHSVDSGATWIQADGTTSWSASVLLSNSGANTIMFRAVDGALPTGNPSEISSITVTYDSTAVFKPALGNFQVKSMSSQNKPEISYDTYTDTYSINSAITGSSKRKATSPGEQAILEKYDLTSFEWSPDYIRNRFKLAKDNAGNADYLVFLMEEEIVQPSYSGWYSGFSNPSVKRLANRPGFSSSYGQQNFEGIIVDYGASSETFFLQLLTAWKKLCNDLNKKCAILGDGQSNPATFYKLAYGGENGVNYIAQNYDLLYLYAYPSTTDKASCKESGFYCAKDKINYWKNDKKFAGKINYILTNEEFGARSDAVVEADFKSAADAGADIISAYPYKNSGDTLATARMLDIWNVYGGTASPQVCTVPPPEHCFNAVQDSALGETGMNCGGPCPACPTPGTKIPDNAVAILRQVAVSIYDKNVVNDPNELFTKNINNYWTKVPSDVNVRVNPFKGYFVPAGTGVYNTLDKNEGFMKGIVWAPEKARSTTTKIAGWSIAEEDAQVRYWGMYDASEYFVDSFGDVVNSYILNSVDTGLSNDYCTPTNTVRNGPYSCPGDCTSAYSGTEFLNSLNAGLGSLSSKLNTVFASSGFTWSVSIPENVLKDSDFASRVYSSAEEKWTVNHYKSCNCRVSGKPPRRTCSTCLDYTDYNCRKTYAREYISNGNSLKILVEITDEKYNTFDSATKTWVKPTFKFYAEFYPFEDNYCNGYECSSISSSPISTTLPTVTYPPPLPTY